ncbi:MAG: exodeoxyribonuclease VII small subunit [Candidatus Sumerlaeia bacterium]|nr:exodeoxyribonuclease VII small subunit [Candidatus Sumerlaeia bacterium]
MAAKKSDAEKKALPLEKSLERLEEIVAKLESGEVSLEKSIELYEEGRRLGGECLERLEVLERRVQLVRERADGTLETEEFEDADEG